MKHVDSRTLTDLPLFLWQVRGWENVKRRCVAQVSPEGRGGEMERRVGGCVGGWVGFTDRVKSGTTVQQCASLSLYFLLLSAPEARRRSLSGLGHHPAGPFLQPDPPGCWSHVHLSPGAGCQVTKQTLEGTRVLALGINSLRHIPPWTPQSRKKGEMKLGLQQRIDSTGFAKKSANYFRIESLCRSINTSTST